MSLSAYSPGANAHVDALLLLLFKRQAGLRTIQKHLPQYAPKYSQRQIDKMIARGLVSDRGSSYALTTAGRAAVEKLRPRDMDRLKDVHGTWQPPRVVRRPGSLDFMRWPSRVGNQRIHREGREKWVS